jgi:chromosome segregation ATPase
MDSDNYKISYLKCQETFLIDVVRRCLEAEAKISILQATIANKDNEINDSAAKIASGDEQIAQLLAGLQVTTVQRDTYREEHARYRDEILALGDLKEKCEKIEKNYEEHMKNYNLVNEAYQNLAQQYEQLKAEHEKLQQQSDKKSVNKVVKLDQAKKDDWS